MKLQTNHDAMEDDWKNDIHIISVHNIPGKQKIQIVPVSYLFRYTLAPFLIWHFQLYISISWRPNLDI